MLDDALQPVTFHGGGWQVTLEFAVEEAESSYAGPVDYRALMAAQNGSVFGREVIAVGQRADTTRSELQRTVGPIRHPSNPS